MLSARRISNGFECTVGRTSEIQYYFTRPPRFAGLRSVVFRLVIFVWRSPFDGVRARLPERQLNIGTASLFGQASAIIKLKEQKANGRLICGNLSG